MSGAPDLSVVVPTLDEGAAIGELVRKVAAQAERHRLVLEILVVDGGSTDDTRRWAEAAGAHVLTQPGRGYADALRAGLRAAAGRFVLTMDGDYSHDPDFIDALWERREAAELVIASRYVPGAHAQMPRSRRLLSRVLNGATRWILSLPLHDVSSGYRLYRREVLAPIATRATHFDVLIELATRIHSEGWRVAEVPFHYRPRRGGRSHASLLRFGVSYARTLLRMWAHRNSLESADYDDRAFSSRIPLQRWWQRRRYAIVLALLDGAGRVLDAGCGSSKILEALPHAVGLDLRFKPLRFRRRTNRRLVQGGVEALPFRDGAFDAVICSEVLEHVAYDPRVFTELRRVLAADGALIVGTPDYGRWQWRWIEWWYQRLLPGAHGHDHVERYTELSLRARLAEFGFRVLEARSICRAELILRCAREG